MVRGVIRFVVFVSIFVVMNSPIGAHGDELYFIDAHSQIDHTMVPLQTVLSIMKQGSVTHTILSARGKLKGKDLLNFASQNPWYITPAIRTKGEPYKKGSSKFYKTLKTQVASKKYSAIAEVLLYHAQKGNKAPEYVVFPEDKRVLTALKYAIDYNWPFIIHIEFSSLHGEKKKRYMESMEKMLDDHLGLPFVLTHMGQLKPSECERLIENHENIHFHTGWTNPVAVKSSNQPWINLFKGQGFAPKWHNLFIQYPDRFIFAIDNVFAEHWTSFYIRQINYWKTALVELPVEVMHLIAHGNAERLWRIPIRD